MTESRNTRTTFSRLHGDARDRWVAELSQNYHLAIVASLTRTQLNKRNSAVLSVYALPRFDGLDLGEYSLDVKTTINNVALAPEPFENQNLVSRGEQRFADLFVNDDAKEWVSKLIRGLDPQALLSDDRGLGSVLHNVHLVHEARLSVQEPVHVTGSVITTLRVRGVKDFELHNQFAVLAS